jgi:hypothetical protein
MKGKGKFHHRTTHEDPEGSRYIALLFLQPRPYMGVGGQRPALGKTRYRLYRWEAGWAQGPVRTDAVNLASPGFDPQTVHPVASRYTD